MLTMVYLFDHKCSEMFKTFIYFCEIPKIVIIQLLLIVLIIRNAENLLLNLWKLCYIFSE